MAKSEGKKLSSAVLDMKFMQRTKKRIEAQEKKKRDFELKEVYLDTNKEITSVEATTSQVPQIQFCKDLSVLEDLAFGRMSFRGFNPEVEKLMLYYQRLKNGDESEDGTDEEKDVGDAEMAIRLSGPSSTIGNKFKTKKQKSMDRLDENASYNRLNFTEVRKRSAGSDWANQDPSMRKFLRPE
uniref:M-phase phosphoprotein 6 n=1 Tax=Heterorhabditis bacteriophora TaxID=37862 RepID=A0A1I7X8Y8_HETBA